MKIRSMLSNDESTYFAQEYAQIDPQAPWVRRFLNEIYRTLVHHDAQPHDSVLDVGCGRGYLLHYLMENGFESLRGIDPCSELVAARLSDAVGPGAFFDDTISEKSFDVVITCHTLHHLHSPDPVQEIAWLAQVARKLVIIVEINNTNLPMLIMSLLHRNVEANAFRYNLAKVKKMCRSAGLDIIQTTQMESGYISGQSTLHRIASRIGTPPYNIVVARP